METLSALLALCEANAPISGGFPSQRLVTRGFYIFFDLRQRFRNHRVAGSLRRNCAHYDVSVMFLPSYTVRTSYMFSVSNCKIVSWITSDADATVRIQHSMYKLKMIINNIKIRIKKSVLCEYYMSHFTPLQQRWKGDILVSTLSVCPSVLLWMKSCPLCIFNNTRRIHFIFTHPIKQHQKVCPMLNYKITKFWQILSICYFDFVFTWIDGMGNHGVAGDILRTQAF